MDLFGKPFKSVGGFFKTSFSNLGLGQKNKGDHDKEDAEPPQYVSWEDPYESIAFSIIYIALICILILVVAIPCHLLRTSFLTLGNCSLLLF